MTRQEDIWTCSECGQEQGRHDQWFEGKCEKCHEQETE
jgi:predicted ATP-dependent serine protease